MADVTDGLSTHELVLEMRGDVKALLAGQGVQNGTLNKHTEEISDLKQSDRELRNRFWGILIGFVAIVVGAIVGMVRSGAVAQ